MHPQSTEIYHPRAISKLGIWDIGALRFKVYGIVADGKELTQTTICDALAFTRSEVPALIEAEGEDNGLGFVIIHPGQLGVSILVHWWVQGSVLCQHIRRTLWGSDVPMNTATRPVVACVWELALINAEQTAWRETMMTATPNPAAYLETRPSAKEV